MNSYRFRSLFFQLIFPNVIVKSVEHFKYILIWNLIVKKTKHNYVYLRKLELAE